MKIGFESIRDDEQNHVKSIVERFVEKETSLFDMFKVYMTNLAMKFDKKW